MTEAHICPLCGGYILGTYCYICKQDIRSLSVKNNSINFMTNFFNKLKQEFKDADN